MKEAVQPPAVQLGRKLRPETGVEEDHALRMADHVKRDGEADLFGCGAGDHVFPVAEKKSGILGLDRNAFDRQKRTCEGKNQDGDKKGEP